MPDEEKNDVNASTCDEQEEVALLAKLGAQEESVEELRELELREIQKPLKDD